MVRITKVYTKTGDQGMTTLAGGQKLSKSALRIQAYGGVDELNAFMGLAAEYLRNTENLGELRLWLRRIQNELFDLGSQLAVLAEDRREDTPVLLESDISRLENEIDRMNGQLPDLKSFVLPGGGKACAYLHVARTVCRRVERDLVSLSRDEVLDGVELPYLNRLSDWLFVAARFSAVQSGEAEHLWKPGDRDLAANS